MRLTSWSTVVTGERSCLVCTSNPTLTNSRTFAPAFLTASTNAANSRSIFHASLCGSGRVAGLAASTKRKDGIRQSSSTVHLTIAENLRTSRGSCEVSTDEVGPETIQKDGAPPGHSCPYRREKNGQGHDHSLQLRRHPLRRTPGPVARCAYATDR